MKIKLPQAKHKKKNYFYNKYLKGIPIAGDKYSPFKHSLWDGEKFIHGDFTNYENKTTQGDTIADNTTS